MQQRLIELHVQRGRLVERIATQRGTLSRQLSPLRGVFSFRQRVRETVNRARAFATRHPFTLAATLTAVVILKPRVVWRWTQLGLVLWRGWRGVRSLLPTALQKRARG